MNIKSVIFLILVAVPSYGWAQYQMINKNSLVIVNNTNATIRYKLKRDIQFVWQAYAIEPWTKVTYKLKSDENLNIRVCTSEDLEDKCVAYLLRRAKRYQLYWNRDKKRWDVAEIKEKLKIN